MRPSSWKNLDQQRCSRMQATLKMLVHSTEHVETLMLMPLPPLCVA